jgi:hypothetical protein
MRLLRTADGGFINAVKIVRLADERGAPAGGGWVARLDDGEEVALASYYSAPGRVERDLPHLCARVGNGAKGDSRLRF